MEKIYILILLTLLQDVLTHSQVGPDIEVIRTKRDEEDIKPPILGISGGREAITGEFPHLAAIGFWRRHDVHWLCGGTLINKRFVLTAAHCLEDKARRLYGKALYVRLGDTALKDLSDDANVQQINVLQRIAHPGYKFPMKYNDIGLLKLKEDAIFNQFVKPACVHNTYSIVQTQAEVAGWGRTDEANRKSGKKLFSVNIDIHHINKCKEVLNQVNGNKYQESLDYSMICAGVLSGGKDSCEGDSGGPLQVHTNSRICDVEVIGIVSFGPEECGLVNTPAIYTRVSNYISWIKSAIKSSY